MSLAALLWLPAVALCLLLLRAMRPGGPASAALLWLAVALLPLFLGGTAALHGRGLARRELQALGASEWPIEVQNGPQRVRLRLSTEQAVCFARATRQAKKLQWQTIGGPLALNENTRVVGKLPPPETVRRAGVLGGGACKRWISVP